MSTHYSVGVKGAAAEVGEFGFFGFVGIGEYGDGVVESVTGDADLFTLGGLVEAEGRSLGVFVDGSEIDGIVVNANIGDVYCRTGGTRYSI